MAKALKARGAKAAIASIDQTTEENGWNNGRFIFTLVKPISVGGEDVEKITLREPTAFDVMEAGNPCTLDPASNPPRVLFDDRKLGAMISRLAAIPPSSVGKMSPKDFSGIGWILADFFLPV